MFLIRILFMLTLYLSLSSAFSIPIPDFNAPKVEKPFTCNDTLYLSNRSKIGTGNNDSGKTWLHSINREVVPYAYTSIGDGFVSTDGGYNALGYNVQDNFMYATYGDHLIKIDKNAVVKDLGKIDGFNHGQLYTGEFDRDGFYYITGTGGADDQMYKIDIAQRKVVKTITLSKKARFWDMAIDKSGEYFYAMLLQDGDSDSSFNNDKVAKIEISTGIITTIGDSHANLPSYIGLTFSDKNGALFMMSNDNGFYKVNTTTGKLQLVSSSQDLTFYNDGTSCPDAIIHISENDFGDAPDKYTHVSHKISQDLYLGESAPDSEDDQLSSAHATGDGADDNDAVVGTLPELTLGDNSYTVPVKVFNNTGKVAKITAWIDFNRDGIFQYDEALNTNHLEIPSSNSPQTVNVTWDNTTDEDTTAIENATVGKAIMRIRLTTSRILRCDDPHYRSENGNAFPIPIPLPNQGHAQENYFVSPDGEVEDYEIEIKDKGNPFECTNEGHVFNSGIRNSFTNGVTIDLESGNLGASTQFATRHINAAGYNVKDNFIYGMGFQNPNHNLTELVKVDRDYNVTTFTVPGLVQTDDNGNELLYAYGDVSFDNKYYFSEYGRLTNLRVIDLTTKTLLPSITLVYPNENSTRISSADYAFNPKDKMLYVVNSTNRQLTRIDPESGVVTELGNVGLGNEDIYSVVSFFDLKGNYYFNNSAANQTFKINISNPDDVNATATPYLSGFQLSSSGDGAKCAYSYISEKDYGDAPDSYPHVGHEVSSNLYLGEHAPDEEDDQQSSVDATGDGEDDNDGVTNLSPILLDSTSYNVPVKVYNKTGKDAYITAWIDFNRNGSFEANEALNNENLIVTSSAAMQEATIEWNNALLLKSLTLGDNIMRIRISTKKIAANNTDSNSPDGEVEDYLIHVVEGGKYGKFNIERTNSGSFPIMTDERNAWYTQIVGRDFNYSLVFYTKDFSAEQNISNVTVKVDLMDMDKNESIYDYSFHIPTPVNKVEKSRITILTKDDLDKLPATRNARFKVTYGVTNKGSLIEEDCLTTPALCTEHRSDLAKDNFAIRPEKFYVSIADGARQRVNSTSPAPISFAAGYDYNLSVKAIKYFKNYPDFNASEGYDAVKLRNLHFTSIGASCRNTNDQDQNITFNDGSYIDSDFSNPFVGEYKLNISDDTTWTKVDQNDRDCIENNNSTSTNSNEPSGCNITQIDNITINFQPDHFDVALNLGTVPASGHQDFVYMSPLTAAYNDVAVQFTGRILAKNENNDTTQNFTEHCVATNVLLDLNATTISTEGINQQIHTILGTPVNFTRFVTYNPNSSQPTTDIINNLVTLNGAITLTADKFLDENNGTVELDMKYNLNKNTTQATNPVQVTFNSMEASSTEANSEAYDKINIQSNIHTPSGFTNFPNNVKNFYFTRVVSKLDIYPTISRKINPLVSTPLYVDFFCNAPGAYCDARNVSANSRLFDTPREQQGWHISARHNGNLDGNVTSLIPNNGIVTIAESGNPVGGVNNNIMLPNGSNGTVTASFNQAGTTTVTIITTPPLTYNPSGYALGAKDVNGSAWTGVGIKGHTLEIKPLTIPSKRMDW